MVSLLEQEHVASVGRSRPRSVEGWLDCLLFAFASLRLGAALADVSFERVLFHVKLWGRWFSDILKVVLNNEMVLGQTSTLSKRKSAVPLFQKLQSYVCRRQPSLQSSRYISSKRVLRLNELISQTHTREQVRGNHSNLVHSRSYIQALAHRPHHSSLPRRSKRLPRLDLGLRAVSPSAVHIA